MKLTPRQYAQALLESTDGRSRNEAAQVVRRLARLVPRAKLTRLWPKIIRSYESLQRRQAGRLRVQLATARPFDQKHLSETIQRTLDQPIDLETAVDTRLIGGAVVTIDDTRRDASLRASLEQTRAKFHPAPQDAASIRAWENLRYQR